MVERATELLLDVVTTIFRLLHLEINFGPNKTLAILLFLGKQATLCREKLRRPDGTLAIALEKFGHPGEWLRIVRSYRHLGTYIDALGVTHGNVIERSKLALGAYAPIAMKVFGSSLIATAFKLCFLRSMVLSKQHFNVQLMIPTAKDIRKLNATYMRGLRRIADELRFDSNENGKTDLQVRQQLGAPSIDCILLVARMRYIIRVVREAPKSLCAALHFRREGQPIPWTRQATQDMLVVAKQSQFAPDSNPSLSPFEWTSWLLSADAAHALRITKFTESIIDSIKPPSSATIANVTDFRCSSCEKSFATQKALNLHCRTVHKFRAPWASRIGSSVCPACGKDFQSRVRCLNHLGDSRRPKCSAWVLAHVSELPEKKLLRS